MQDQSEGLQHQKIRAERERLQKHMTPELQQSGSAAIRNHPYQAVGTGPLPWYDSAYGQKTIQELFL